MAGFLRTTTITTDAGGYARIAADPRRVFIRVRPIGFPFTYFNFGESVSATEFAYEVNVTDGLDLSSDDYGSVVGGPMSLQTQFGGIDVAIIEALCQ